MIRNATNDPDCVLVHKLEWLKLVSG